MADAANYVLQGVLGGGGTAFNRGIGIPAAAKTGTANGGYYAAFAGYTPRLAGYVSVFNPFSPTGSGAMIYPRADYREVDGSLSASQPDVRRQRTGRDLAADIPAPAPATEAVRLPAGVSVL